MKRAAFTIATGRPIYLQMAFALARSFRRWNANSDIEFFIVTDAPITVFPGDLKDTKLIGIRDGQYGSGFVPKLHLDKMAPAECSLFIDADCLCVRSLEETFSAFRGHAVSAVGREISTGEWCGDIRIRCQRFGLTAVPRFNGGIYYLEPGERCSRIFQTAREILPSYDDYGFTRLRQSPNEEPLISLAMAIHGEKPIEDTGRIMNCLLDAPAGIELDVLQGRAVLHCPRNHPQRTGWHDLTEMRPAVVHLNAIDVRDYPYSAEVLKLQLIYQRKLPAVLARLWTAIYCTAPSVSLLAAKKILRPLYRLTFGVRKIRANGRLA